MLEISKLLRVRAGVEVARALLHARAPAPLPNVRGASMRPVSLAVVLALAVFLGSSCSKDTTGPGGLQSCSITANSLSFGNANLGACTAVQSFVITNFTSGTLTGSIGETCPDF